MIISWTQSNTFFFIGNRNFIEKEEHRVHNDEKSDQETNAYNSRTKANRLQKIRNGNTLCKTPDTKPEKQNTKKRRL